MADQFDSIAATAEATSRTMEQSLQSIDLHLASIVRNGINLSQSSIADLRDGTTGQPIPDRRNRDSDENDPTRWRPNRSDRDSSNNRNANRDDSNRNRNNDSDSNSRSSNNRRPNKPFSFDSLLDDFEAGLKESLLDSLMDSNLGESIKRSLADFADTLGVDVSDLGKEAGRMLGRSAMDLISQSPLGNEVVQQLQGAGQAWSNLISGQIDRGAANLRNSANGQGEYTFNDLLGRNPRQQDADDAGTNISDAIDTVNDVRDAMDLVEGQGSNVIDIEPYLEGGSGEIESAAADALSGAAGDVGSVAGDLAGAATDMEVLGEAGATAAGDLVAAGAGAAEAGAGAATLATAGAEAGAGLAAAGAGAVELGALFPPALIAMAAAVVAIEVLSEAIGPAIEGIGALWEAADAAAHSTEKLASFNLDAAKDKLKKDYQSLIEAQYKVIQDAAEKAQAAWDNALRTVTATQGYTKADLQSLLSAYSSRLRAEGLTNVVSTADILENLKDVLSSGLSGQAAEEFAYLATVLNDAVPTQDFFQYASTYASIAANAIASGQSQAAAIEYANQELKSFANNLLYSSRELAGGFSTGLQNASGLLESAVQIATASRTGDASQISGVLTSVSAIVGAVAPDLAGSIVDAVVSAATKGNSSELTALRSLAGTGASNTSFLKALASNPQAIFSTLFKNLASLQQMSADNFMEVAEGLSKIFGVSMDAFARVDFNYLADAISQMNVNSNALDQNMSLLAEGQTTATAEQARIAQVNQYLLEEGLSYVLDNEVARSVQEHMWDEQLAREIEQTEFAVNLQGAALQFLQGIAQTVENILNFLNPIGWLKPLTNLFVAGAQSVGLASDLRNVLLRGNVGQQNAKTLTQLTSANKDLHLAKSYIEILGGHSAYRDATNAGRIAQSITGSFVATHGSLLANGYNAFANSILTDAINSASGAGGPISSRYNWGMVGKNMSATGGGSSYNSGSAYDAVSGASSANQGAASSSALQKFINTISSSASKGEGFDKWAKTAKSYGISDLDAALNDYGLTMQDLESQYQNAETTEGSKQKHEREVKQDKFVELGTTWFEEEFPSYAELVCDKLTTINDSIGYIQEYLEQTMYGKPNGYGVQGIGHYSREYLEQWKSYYLNFATYRGASVSWNPGADETSIGSLLGENDGWSSRNYGKAMNNLLKNREDTALKLANILAGANSQIQDLKDPTMQTNVLLAKILLVAEAIMQQNNDTSTVSLPTALSALGLGVTNT